MKKNYLKFALGAICFTIISCKTETFEKENLISDLTNYNMIEEAEKNLGPLVKLKKTYTDPKSGSTFELLFAGKTNENLELFFNDNEISIIGIDKKEKQRLFKTVNNKLLIENSNNTSLNSNYIEDNVFYHIIKKDLKNGDVGFGFTIKPKKEFSKIKNESLRPAYSWRQQTSLPWCELAVITPIVENPVRNYFLYFQVRGIFWNGSGSPFWNMPTNGQSYTMAIDGPKFTRFGGENITYDKFHVTWYDFESGASIND